MQRLKLRLIASVVVLLLIGCAGAFAQPPLTITSSGYYITVVGADGVPQLVKITTVIDMTGGDSTPAPPGVDEIDSALAQQVKDWANTAADPQAAQGIAAVYSHIRGAVDDGLLDPVTVWPAFKNATDSAIVVVDGGKKWDEFRTKLSAVVTEGRQRGTLQTPASVSRMARSVQHGLELAADGSDALPLDKLTAIAAKTNEAIDAEQ